MDEFEQFLEEQERSYEAELAKKDMWEEEQPNPRETYELYF